jgi:flagellar basal body-associated protein FliL
MVFVVGSYAMYAVASRQSFMPPSIPEVSRAEYLVVVPYYPQFYFTFNKEAPDRYYQPFFLLDYFNENSAEDVKRHKALNKDKLKKTLFMIVEFSETDKELTSEYLQKFGRVFQLSKKKVYQYENGRIELYSSRL